MLGGPAPVPLSLPVASGRTATAWSTRLAAALAVFAVANVLVFGYLVTHPPFGPARAARQPLALSLDVRGYGWDSWAGMLIASDYLRLPGEGRLYHDVFFEQGGKLQELRARGAGTTYPAMFLEQGLKFQYPPTSLLAVDVVRELVPRFHPKHVLNAISFILTLAIAPLVAVIFLQALADSSPPASAPADRRDTVLLAALAIGMTLTFYPVVRAAAMGQIQAWLNFLATLAVCLFVRGHEKAAGVAAGLLLVVKPHYGALVLWGVLRRRWSFAASAAATAGAILAVSIACYGLQNHLDYLAVLSYLGRHGEVYYLNQSVNGLLNRALHTGDSLAWDFKGFAPFHPVVFAGTAAASVAVFACAFWRPRAPLSPTGRRVDLAIVLLALTMAAPIAWEHHYAVLLPVFALVVPALRRWPVFGGATFVVVAVTYVLASNMFFNLTALAADTPFNAVQSYLFFAALVVLVMLCRLRARVRAAGA